MEKTAQHLPVKDQKNFKNKMLNWADRFNIFCFLDNNGYESDDHEFEWLLAAGSVNQIAFNGNNDFHRLQKFHDLHKNWLFGHLSYNAAGNAYTENTAADIDFGKGFFFEPQILIGLKGERLELIKSDLSFSEIITQIENTIPSENLSFGKGEYQSETRDEYLQSIRHLHQHIKRGDCYEINFCRKFSADNILINPVQTYQQLTELSPVPFASLYKLDDRYCICASPERFLKKKNNLLISQPIKGTAPRDNDDVVNDEKNKADLIGSEKERSENVMIVDLVRNDLSIVCEKASVKVRELFGVYTFPRVHHLISTIEGKLSADKNFTDAISACYPMGSMTGAPKKRVMELIEKYEGYDRGLFSGSIGYITPEGDFDFNVVIRSIFADIKNKKVSFFAGSGIIFNSIAENEYEECEAKAEAMKKVLSAKD